MPEGPEVATMADGLRDIVGKKIVSVTCTTHKHLALAGHQFPLTVTAVYSRVKKLIIACRDMRGVEGNFMISPLMSGVIRRRVPGNNTRCTWIVGDLVPGTPPLCIWREAIYYDGTTKFGPVVYLSNDELQAEFAQLGPDILRMSGPAELYEHVMKATIRTKKTTTIATVLLNQKIFAGIGNIYRSDSLFLAGIHPMRQVGTLTNIDWSNLCCAAYNTLQNARAAGGCSIKDYVLNDGRKAGYKPVAYKQTMCQWGPIIIMGDKGSEGKKKGKDERSIYVGPHQK